MNILREDMVVSSSRKLKRFPRLNSYPLVNGVGNEFFECSSLDNGSIDDVLGYVANAENICDSWISCSSELPWTELATADARSAS